LYLRTKDSERAAERFLELTAGFLWNLVLGFGSPTGERILPEKGAQKR
jgi:hypothetical protein